MALPIAHNEQEIIVGKYYSVCHAILIDGRTNKQHSIPIIPNLHSDKQFGVPYEHYHIDGRFIISKFLEKELRIEEGITSTIISPVASGMLWTFKKIIYINKKCIRKYSGLPETFKSLKEIQARLLLDTPNYWRALEFTKQYWGWYAEMVGKSCAGKKCPHRGSIMAEKDGKLVCPLHSLIGDVKTEKICWPDDKPIIFEEEPILNFAQYIKKAREEETASL